MPEVRRRRTSSTTSKPVSRRRDRAREEDVDEDEDEEETRPARRTKAKTTTTKRRRPEPVEEDEDLDDEDLDDEDEDEDEEAPAPRPRRPAAKKKTTTRRRPARDEEDDDEDEEERPARKRSAAKSSSSKSKLPPGVRRGNSGIEEVRELGGSFAPRLKLTKAAQLIKILENDTITFRQHWVSPGGNVKGNRPFTCPVTKCPLCHAGNHPSQTIIVNVLLLSGVEEPTNKILQMGIKAWENLKDKATRKGKLNLQMGYFAVNKSGSDSSAQTNFVPVKERDLEDDWDEIFEHFAPEDLADIIAEGKENMFSMDQIVQTTPLRELRDLARHLIDDDDEDDDEDDE